MSVVLLKQIADLQLALFSAQVARDEARLSAMDAAQQLMVAEYPRVQASLAQANTNLLEARRDYAAKFPEPKP